MGKLGGYGPLAISFLDAYRLANQLTINGGGGVNCEIFDSCN